MKWQHENSSNSSRSEFYMHRAGLQLKHTPGHKSSLSFTVVLNCGNTQTFKANDCIAVLPRESVLICRSCFRLQFPQSQELIAWQFDCPLTYHFQEFQIITPPSPTFCRLQGIAEQFAEDHYQNDQFQEEMLKALLHQLLILLTRTAVPSEARPSHSQQLISHFNSLVESHFRSHHSVQFYARTMCKSPKTITNLFYSFKYPSPSSIIQQRIIEEAKRYLLYSDMSAKEISNALGFASPSHFSRFFKKNTGTSSSLFKSSNRGVPEIGS